MLRPTILVVDDEVNILLIMSEILKDIGLVVTASSVYEAQGWLARTKVDLLLCDYNIGKDCMVDLLDILTPGIKMVGMSASPKWDCPLPSYYRNMPWLEKGGSLRVEKVRLTVLEALST